MQLPPGKIGHTLKISAKINQGKWKMLSQYLDFRKEGEKSQYCQPPEYADQEVRT